MSSADLLAPLNHLELTKTFHLKGNLHVTHHHWMPRSLVIRSLPQLVRAAQEDPQIFALEVPAPLVEKSEPPHLSANTVFVPLSTPDEDELRNNVPAGRQTNTILQINTHERVLTCASRVVSVGDSFLRQDRLDSTPVEYATDVDHNS